MVMENKGEIVTYKTEKALRIKPVINLINKQITCQTNFSFLASKAHHFQ